MIKHRLDCDDRKSLDSAEPREVSAYKPSYFCIPGAPWFRCPNIFIQLNFTKIIHVQIHLCDTWSKGAVDQKSFGFCKCFGTLSTTVAQHILGKEKNYGVGKRALQSFIPNRSKLESHPPTLNINITDSCFF